MTTTFDKAILTDLATSPDKARKGNWMQVYSGKQFWPFDPRPGDFDILDIATALSRLCRFGGHTKEFYSVAEHCVYVSHCVAEENPEYALWGLMHDASEAYVQDLIRPIKYAMPEYQAIEDRVQEALAKQFELEWPMPKEVHRADVSVLLAESRDIMLPPPAPWSERGVPPFSMRIEGLSPEEAKNAFLGRYYDLTC